MINIVVQVMDPTLSLLLTQPERLTSFYCPAVQPAVQPAPCRRLAILSKNQIKTPTTMMGPGPPALS